MAQIAFMATASTVKLDISSAILLDTGCSQHTFHNEDIFTEIRRFQPHEMTKGITSIGKTVFQPMGTGTVNLEVSVGGQKSTLTLTDVLWCPSLRANLVSASQLLDKNAGISLTKHGCIITAPDGEIAAEACAEYGLFLLHTWLDHQVAMMAYSSSNDPVQRLWHEHMGHLGVQNLKRLQSMSTGLDLTHIPHEDCTCEACLLGHMKDVPHRESLAKNARPYEVIFSDVEGPMSVTSHDGS